MGLFVNMVCALNGVAEFKREYDNDDEVKRLVDLAMQLEGLPRNSSTHAAGVVIGDRPLAQLVPLYRDPRSDMPVTQFDMKYVEDSGLVKFDFLGLKTLSVLKKALDLLVRRRFYDTLLNDYMDEERTILVTTHQVEEVENLLFVAALAMLAPAAIEAVKQWKYKPYLLNGEPVEVDLTATTASSLPPAAAIRYSPHHTQQSPK